MTEASRSYPRTLECGGDAVELNRLQASDRAALVEFVARLPTTDLLFVPRDINHPKVIDAWMAALQDRLVHDELGALAPVVAGRLRPVMFNDTCSIARLNSRGIARPTAG